MDHEEARMQAARNELDRQAAAAQAASLATAAKPLHVPSTAARSGQILVQLPVVRTDRYADLGPQVTLAENLATVTLVKQQAKAIADLQAIVAEQHKALGELRKQVKLAVTREELGSVITPMVRSHIGGHLLVCCCTDSRATWSGITWRVRSRADEVRLSLRGGRRAIVVYLLTGAG